MLLIEIGLGLGLESDKRVRVSNSHSGPPAHLQNKIKKSRDSALASELVIPLHNHFDPFETYLIIVGKPIAH